MHTESSLHDNRRTRSAVQTRGLTATEAVLIAILMVALAVTLAAALRTPTANLDTPTITIRVENADTLWNIASRHSIPGRGTAETVDLITDLNGLSSSSLSAGQTLLVPAVRPVGEVAQR